MKINSIQLKNFRSFKDLEVKFHPNLTVLIAKNGAGKTTILDALRIAVWPYVKGFDLGSQTGKSATIQIGDVHLQTMRDGNMEAQLPSVVNAKCSWSMDEAQYSWEQWRESIKKATNTKSDMGAVKYLFKHAKKLQEEVRSDKSVDLPIICYLGTGRLWYEGRHTSQATDVMLDQNEYSRLSGYLNCITQSSGFKQFKDWYSWVSRSYLEEQILALQKNQHFDFQNSRFAAVVHVVQRSINTLITEQTGWRDISYSAKYNQQLVLTHPDHGVLPLEFLSDGLRNMVAMVADIAYRCIKLNPHFGYKAAHQTAGVVMIDEVDMFLHPEWQQTVLSSLQKAFPKIQFIVTTHSPQVLSSVPKGCIRVITKSTEGRDIATEPMAYSYGEPSNDILHAIMNVDPQPPIPEKSDLKRLTSIVEQGDYDNSEVAELLRNLIETLNPSHPQIQKIMRSIKRQRALRG